MRFFCVALCCWKTLSVARRYTGGNLPSYQAPTGIFCGKKWFIVGDSGILIIRIDVKSLGFGAKKMFRGVNGVNIDEKGRVVVPTRYRERLQNDGIRGGVVLTIDTEERCLLLYPVAAWEEIENKLAALPSFNPAARRIQRLLIGHATETEIDSHGRILLPPLLREYAGLSKLAMIVGQGKKMEIWDEAHWQKRRSEWLDEESNSISNLPEEVKTLSL
jgi:MraZ protein